MLFSPSVLYFLPKCYRLVEKLRNSIVKAGYPVYENNYTKEKKKKQKQTNKKENHKLSMIIRR